MDTITQTIEEATQQVIAAGNSLLVIALALSIIPYTFFGIGLSSVASRYGLRTKWMAWIPIARKHLLAELADIRRAQAGKHKRLAVQYEILMCLFLACAFLVFKSNNVNVVIAVIMSILACLLFYNQAFSYYYFYRLCDMENGTIYFLLGLVVKPLNSFFVYHCR